MLAVVTNNRNELKSDNEEEVVQTQESTEETAEAENTPTETQSQP